LQEAQEQDGASKTSFWVGHLPKKFPNYVVLMSSIVDAKPSSFEEANLEHFYTMVEEYRSICKIMFGR
jgi:hypothetical protein